MSKVDKALEVGAGFDWIGPLVSMFRTATSDHKGWKVPADFAQDVNGAAWVLDVKLRGAHYVGDWYCFDCRAKEMKAIQKYLGWQL